MTVLRRVVQRLVDARPMDPPPASMSRAHLDHHDVAYRLCAAGPEAPVALLESGLGAPAVSWSHVQESLQRAGVTSIAHDRPGIGWTAPMPHHLPPSAHEHGRQVASLLNELAPEARVWLVGHSVGALLMRFFAATHPRRVAGLVLVDPTDPDQMRSAGQRDATAAARHQVAGALARALVPGRTSGDGGNDRAALSRAGGDPGTLLTTLAEMARWEAGWGADARAAKLPDVPLLVVSASSTRRDPLMAQMHDQMAALTPRGRSLVIEGEHMSLLLDPEVATTTADAIADAVHADGTR